MFLCLLNIIVMKEEIEIKNIYIKWNYYHNIINLLLNYILIHYEINNNKIKLFNKQTNSNLLMINDIIINNDIIIKINIKYRWINIID